ncbi:MAG TPA: hypothetical protein VK427_02205, partial [Kofleriaceae bacterium]|nr:hypothetical protein [Kofleriaceae bacterium]
MHAASPLLVGALACAAALAVIAMVSAAAATQLGAWISAAARLDHATDARLGPQALVAAVLDLAAPFIGAAAIVAIFAHVGQTRALWLPRRRIA